MNAARYLPQSLRDQPKSADLGEHSDLENTIFDLVEEIEYEIDEFGVLRSEKKNSSKT